MLVNVVQLVHFLVKSALYRSQGEVTQSGSQYYPTAFIDLKIRLLNTKVVWLQQTVSILDKGTHWISSSPSLKLKVISKHQCLHQKFISGLFFQMQRESFRHLINKQSSFCTFDCHQKVRCDKHQSMAIEITQVNKDAITKNRMIRLKNQS